MNANELRIGNLVNGTLGIDNVLTVESILSSTLIAFLHSDDKEILYEYQLENLKPIELSPEWLTRFGFRSDLKDWFWIETVKNQYLASNPHGVYLSNTDPDDESKSADEFWVKLEIQYVHQLQNLYFALTGKELTFLN